MQLLRPLAQITAGFAGTHGQFVAGIFARARQGTKWYALNPDTVAEALGVERRRVVRALEYLEEQGWAVVRASDVRQRYTRLAERPDVDALAADILGRFEKREAQERARLRQVESIVDSLGTTARIVLRRQWGAQSSGFLAGLPLGLVLPSHLKVPAAVREAM